MIFVKNNKIEWKIFSLFIFSTIMVAYFASLQQSNLDAKKYYESRKNMNKTTVSTGINPE